MSSTATLHEMHLAKSQSSNVLVRKEATVTAQAVVGIQGRTITIYRAQVGAFIFSHFVLVLKAEQVMGGKKGHFNFFFLNC